MSALIVIAKAPRPGHVKTRLCPPCTSTEAAALAEAALRDTLEVVAATVGDRRVLALDGEPGPWLPDGFEIVPQRGDGLAERLGNAFADVGERALLIGMDTPQVSPALLADGLRRMGETDAVLGPAADGGYWAVGLRAPDPRVFAGVPMSAPDTATRQRARLRELGLHVSELPTLVDVDTIREARRVARDAPDTRFAQALRRQAA